MAAEGIRLPAAALLVADKLAAGDAQKPVVAAYSKAYQERYKEVSSFGGHAYDRLMLMVDAIKRAGGTDKAKIRDALEATRGYVGSLHPDMTIGQTVRLLTYIDLLQFISYRCYK